MTKQIFSAIDGSPSDQIIGSDGDITWHVLCTITSHSYRHLSCIGHEIQDRMKCKLKKWSSVRGQYKNKFIKAAMEIGKTHDDIFVWLCSANEQLIQQLSDVYIESNGMTPFIIPDQERPGTHKLVNIHCLKETLSIPRNDIRIHNSEFAVLVWYTQCLARLYGYICRAHCIKPVWRLHSDKMAGGNGVDNLWVLKRLLWPIENGKLVISTTPDKLKESKVDLLVDCFAGWAREYKKNDTKPRSRQFYKLFNDPEYEERFHLVTHSHVDWTKG